MFKCLALQPCGSLSISVLAAQVSLILKCAGGSHMESVLAVRKGRGCRGVRWVVALHPQSGSRGDSWCVTHAIHFFSFFVQTRTRVPRVMLPTRTLVIRTVLPTRTRVPGVVLPTRTLVPGVVLPTLRLCLLISVQLVWKHLHTQPSQMHISMVVLNSVTVILETNCYTLLQLWDGESPPPPPPLLNCSLLSI